MYDPDSGLTALGGSMRHTSCIYEVAVASPRNTVTFVFSQLDVAAPVQVRYACAAVSTVNDTQCGGDGNSTLSGKRPHASESGLRLVSTDVRVAAIVVSFFETSVRPATGSGFIFSMIVCPAGQTGDETASRCVSSCNPPHLPNGVTYDSCPAGGQAGGVPSKCALRCHNGFVATSSVASVVGTCTAGGNYFSAPIDSLLHCCPAVAHCRAGHLTCDSSSSSVCQSCDDGFSPSVNASQCIKSSRSSATRSLQSVGCSALTNGNGYVFTSGCTSGSVTYVNGAPAACTVMCADGYYEAGTFTAGDRDVFCTSSGAFSYNLVCTAATCPALTTAGQAGVDNVVVGGCSTSGAGHFTGTADTCSVQCADGYHAATGTAAWPYTTTTTCRPVTNSNTAAWDYTLSCVATLCVIPSVSYATSSGCLHPDTIGDSCTLTCDYQYAGSSGPSSVTGQCLVDYNTPNRDYRPLSLSCPPAPCTPPADTSVFGWNVVLDVCPSGADGFSTSPCTLKCANDPTSGSGSVGVTKYATYNLFPPWTDAARAYYAVGGSTVTLVDNTWSGAALSQFDIILVQDIYYPDPTFGNALADYYDAGGSVILGFMNCDMGGRWTTGGYDPFVRNGQAFQPQAIASIAHANAITAGATPGSIRGPTSSEATVASNAELIATFDDGFPVGAVIWNKGTGKPIVAFAFSIVPGASEACAGFDAVCTTLVLNAVAVVRASPLPTVTGSCSSTGSGGSYDFTGVAPISCPRACSAPDLASLTLDSNVRVPTSSECASTGLLGSTCVFTCADGYVSSGARSATCVSDDTQVTGARYDVSTVTIVCTASNCAAISDNAALFLVSTCGLLPVGSTCTVTCANGYKDTTFGNTNNVVCTADLHATTASYVKQYSTLVCTASSCAAVNLAGDGSQVGGCAAATFSAASPPTCQIGCKDGYKNVVSGGPLSAAGTCTGQTDGSAVYQFTPSVPTCTPAACAAVTLDATTKYSGTCTDGHFSATASQCTVVCNTNYRFTSTDSAAVYTCSIDAGMPTASYKTSNTLTCLPNTCPSPTFTPSSHIQAVGTCGVGNAMENTQCTYGCMSGYGDATKLTGTITATCKIDSTGASYQATESLVCRDYCIRPTFGASPPGSVVDATRPRTYFALPTVNEDLCSPNGKPGIDTCRVELSCPYRYALTTDIATIDLQCEQISTGAFAYVWPGELEARGCEFLGLPRNRKFASKKKNNNNA